MKKFFYRMDCVLLLCACVYMIMLLDTCSVVWDMKNVSYNRVPDNQIVGKAIERYTWDDVVVENWEVYDSDTYVIVPIVVHNFLDGYMWVLYSRKAVSREDGYMVEELCILSKFQIHKENGKWEILNIEEAV